MSIPKRLEKFRTFLQMTGESQNLRYDILVTGDYEYTGCPKKGVHKKLLEYNITFLSIEKTGRKPCSIRERIRHSENKYVT